MILLFGIGWGSRTVNPLNFRKIRRTSSSWRARDRDEHPGRRIRRHAHPLRRRRAYILPLSVMVLEPDLASSTFCRSPDGAGVVEGLPRRRGSSASSQRWGMILLLIVIVFDPVTDISCVVWSVCR